MELRIPKSGIDRVKNYGHFWVWIPSLLLSFERVIWLPSFCHLRDVPYFSIVVQRGDFSQNSRTTGASWLLQIVHILILNYCKFRWKNGTRQMHKMFIIEIFHISIYPYVGRGSFIVVAFTVIIVGTVLFIYIQDKIRMYMRILFFFWGGGRTESLNLNVYVHRVIHYL